MVSLPLLAAALLAAPPPQADDFVVAGYLPDYRLAGYDLDRAAGVTDLILFSAEPTAAGGLDLSRLDDAPWAEIAAWKTRRRVRVLLAVGGWGRGDAFAELAASSGARSAFAVRAVRVCLDRRLDGVDLDWEHPRGDRQAEGYAALVRDLAAAFAPHGLLVSVTVAPAQSHPAGGFAAADRVQVMAYDRDGRHATFAGAEASIAALLEAGVPAEKLVLGLPFYGRGVDDRRRTATYAELCETGVPDGDERDGLFFNGPATIRRKVAFAREAGLAGVMAWELGQDAVGEGSLLRVVAEAAGQPPTASRTNSASK